ncbi:MAG: hypothetical protein ABFD98_18305 [Syntrophobacteraceae bacterium]|nr:hypothetical protein [Desulfobacteraceae bacterium]
METLKAYWTGFVNFLIECDMNRVAEVLRKLDWTDVLRNPWVWLVTIAFLLCVLVKRAFRTLLFTVSLVLFAILLQHTLPPPGESLQLSSLLRFVGGSMVLAVVNIYYLVLGTHR